jgi:16S rRNA (guanine966-N2)-methyltransferase
VPDAGRVVAGSARGVRLTGAGEGTRPLSDRLKQGLFGALESGSLGPWPVPFLDLFAGAGSAGIEALSRGAPAATFVERHGKAVRAIKDNLARAGLADRAHVVEQDVERYLAGPSGGPPSEPFGAVVLDPPYGDAAMLAALQGLGAAAPGLLAEGAVVVAKHFWRDALPEAIGRLGRERERRFGETLLTFYVAGPGS